MQMGKEPEASAMRREEERHANNDGEQRTERAARPHTSAILELAMRLDFDQNDGDTDGPLKTQRHPDGATSVMGNGNGGEHDGETAERCVTVGAHLCFLHLFEE